VVGPEEHRAERRRQGGDTNGLTLAFRRFQKLRDHLPGLVVGRSWHSRLPFMRYDRVYFCENFKLLSEGTVMTPLTQVASDHLPLKATLSSVNS
jgi:endonuclease/exonuclease/phosphatase family metal-dependent hydrolase